MSAWALSTSGLRPSGLAETVRICVFCPSNCTATVWSLDVARKSGHFGRDKTWEKVCSRYYWLDVVKAIDNYIETCPEVQSTPNKVSRRCCSLPLQADLPSRMSRDYPEWPRERICESIAEPSVSASWGWSQDLIHLPSSDNWIGWAEESNNHTSTEHVHLNDQDDWDQLLDPILSIWKSYHYILLLLLSPTRTLFIMSKLAKWILSACTLWLGGHYLLAVSVQADTIR